MVGLRVTVCLHICTDPLLPTNHSPRRSTARWRRSCSSSSRPRARSPASSCTYGCACGPSGRWRRRRLRTGTSSRPCGASAAPTPRRLRAPRLCRPPKWLRSSRLTHRRTTIGCAYVRCLWWAESTARRTGLVQSKYDATWSAHHSSHLPMPNIHQVGRPQRADGGV